MTTFYCACGHASEVDRPDGNRDPYRCEKCGGDMALTKAKALAKPKPAPTLQV